MSENVIIWCYDGNSFSFFLYFMGYTYYDQYTSKTLRRLLLNRTILFKYSIHE